MSKQSVDALIPAACQAISVCELSDGNGKMDKALRGQISAFGAAVTMGTLLSAVAFFSEKGGARSDRQLLMKAIHWMLFPEDRGVVEITETSLMKKLVAAADPNVYRERIIDAAIAIKLAMNMFDIGKGEKDSQTREASE